VDSHLAQLGGTGGAQKCGDPSRSSLGAAAVHCDALRRRAWKAEFNISTNSENAIAK